MTTGKVLVAVLGTVAFLGLAAHRAVAQPDAAALLPHAAWDCGMPEGIPSPESGNLIFQIAIPLDRAADIGRTQFGDRRIAVGREGSIAGPRLSGTVMEGALDYELTLANGTIEIEQILVLRAPMPG